MDHRSQLRGTDLEVFPVQLGGNVFGWTADEKTSFSVLDAYRAAGGNSVDTADVYMERGTGNSGGESEEIIGDWMAARGNRAEMVIATKVGSLSTRKGLSAQNIRAACEDSLRRLKTDYIDLYYAHRDDENTPLEETLGAFDELVKEGKVRYIGASNYTAERLSGALSVSRREGFAEYAVLQPHYNLMERSGYENGLAGLLEREDMSSMPYFSLAKGFLTGKYRPGGEEVSGPRAAGARAYLDKRGVATLEVLDAVAESHGTTVAAVSLAWLISKPTVGAPIASARNEGQLAGILPAADLELTDDELTRLDGASAS